MEEENPKSNPILNVFLMFLLLWASFYTISATTKIQVHIVLLENSQFVS